MQKINVSNIGNTVESLKSWSALALSSLALKHLEISDDSFGEMEAIGVSDIILSSASLTSIVCEGNFGKIGSVALLEAAKCGTLKSAVVTPKQLHKEEQIQFQAQLKLALHRESKVKRPITPTKQGSKNSDSCKCQ